MQLHIVKVISKMKNNTDQQKLTAGLHILFQNKLHQDFHLTGLGQGGRGEKEKKKKVSSVELEA